MLHLIKKNQCLTVFRDEQPVLTHSSEEPCATLGSFELEIEMRHGMYELRRDHPRWKKTLTEARVVEAGSARVELEFSGILRLIIDEEADCARITPLLVGLEDEARHAGRPGTGPHQGQAALSSLGDARANWLSLSLPIPPGETVLGGGEQFSHVDLRGKVLPLWTSEPGVGRGPNYVKLLANIHSRRGGSREHTYFPQPSFVSSEGTWALATTTAFSRMDFTRRGFCRIETYEIPETIRLGKTENAGAASACLGVHLGRQPALPHYFYEGLVLGAQGGSGIVSAKLETARRAGIPVVALWCQDWQGVRMTPYGKQLFWNWAYDPSLYPDLPHFIDSLHDQGLRFMGYNNPFLSTDAPLYAEGARSGFFVKSRDGRPYETYTTTFAVSPVDLFDPAARAWFKSIIKENMIGVGMDGWMADFGEYLPPDGVLSGAGIGCGGAASSSDADFCAGPFAGATTGPRVTLYADPYTAHNRYPVEWAAVNAEAVRESGRVLGGDGGAPRDGRAGRSITFFCRSGYSGSTRFAPLFWAGDQAVNFMRDFGMPAALAAGISSAMSGVGYWHFDIGGFFSFAWIRRSRELLMRSCEFAAFTQVMRTHEGINPVVNAQFDVDAGMLRHFARMTRVHAALAPYHAWLSERYQESGVPPISPVLLEKRRQGLRVSADQYFYGPDLIVAPVLRRGARSRVVEFPEGHWYDFWTGKEVGPRVTSAARFESIDAPLGRPPVFYRDGSEFSEIFRKAARAADNMRVADDTKAADTA